MASRTLPGLGLNGFWSLGEDGWKTGMDANLLLLSVMTQAKAISRVTALPGSPTNGDIYIVPSGAGSNANEIAARDNGAWVYIVPVEGDRVYVSDENAHVVWSGSAWELDLHPYDLPLSYPGGPPVSDEVIGRYVVVRDVILPANFSSSSGWIGDNPTASFAIKVNDDGVQIGTITYNTSGVASFTTTSGTAKTIAAGSLVEFVAPTVVDATAADIAATLKGSAR